MHRSGEIGAIGTPMCIAALEMRSGRVVQQWQGEFSRLPPYRIDAGALVVSYLSTAEFGVHIALGWPQPAASRIDRRRSVALSKCDA